MPAVLQTGPFIVHVSDSLSSSSRNVALEIVLYATSKTSTYPHIWISATATMAGSARTVAVLLSLLMCCATGTTHMG